MSTELHTSAICFAGWGGKWGGRVVPQATHHTLHWLGRVGNVSAETQTTIWLDGLGNVSIKSHTNVCLGRVGSVSAYYKVTCQHLLAVPWCHASLELRVVSLDACFLSVAGEKQAVVDAVEGLNCVLSF